MEKTDLDRKGIPAENEAGAEGLCPCGCAENEAGPEGLSPCGCAAEDPSGSAEVRKNGRNSDEADAADAVDAVADAACCCRTKARSEKEQRDLINRLSRIEGQIRGLKGMIERDAYCIDIINQAAAASSALSSFSKVLLTCHIRTCVEEDIREGREEKVDELVKTLQKLLR